VTLTVEFDREEDGRWLADIPALPGVMVYGSTREEALSNVKALALHVLADMIEHGELGNPPDTVVFTQSAAA
jgi:predicted RNase H-like HicB family nuclease